MYGTPIHNFTFTNLSPYQESPSSRTWTSVPYVHTHSGQLDQYQNPIMRAVDVPRDATFHHLLSAEDQYDMIYNPDTAGYGGGYYNGENYNDGNYDGGYYDGGY